MKKATMQELLATGLTNEQIDNLIKLGVISLVKDTSKFEKLADYLEQEITYLLANYEEPIEEAMGNLVVVLRGKDFKFVRSNLSGVKTTIDAVYVKDSENNVFRFDNWYDCGVKAMTLLNITNSRILPYSRSTGVVIPVEYIEKLRALKFADNEILSKYKQEHQTRTTAKSIYDLLGWEVVGYRSNGQYCNQDLVTIEKPAWID